jgi:hypothetical protein
MRSGRRVHIGLLIQVIAIAFFLPTVTSSAQLAKPGEVKFCDLIRDAAKYDGKLVKTTALYSRKIDGDSLSSKDCQSTLNEQHSADPIVGHDFNQSSRNGKALTKTSKKRGSGGSHGRRSCSCLAWPRARILPSAPSNRN